MNNNRRDNIAHRITPSLAAGEGWGGGSERKMPTTATTSPQSHIHTR